MIFLSHNHQDKPIVEEFAVRLKNIFGESNVFYDSWSIQPGDGIVDRMNEALEKCRLFLFFVSRNSLRSKMVELEWQNAVLKATRGQTRLVPVKLDDCLMPPILAQTLYIDLFGQGLEVAVRQVMDVATGRNTFRRGPQEFSNLRAYQDFEEDTLLVEVHAEYFLEPISHFLFVLDNDKIEFDVKCRTRSMFYENFIPSMTLNDGSKHNAQLLSIEQGTLPGFPFIAEFGPRGNAHIQLVSVLHEVRENYWRQVPLVGKP